MSFKLQKVAKLGRNFATSSLLPCLNNNLPTIKCCINSYFVNALVDSGASVSLINQRYVNNVKRISNYNVMCTNGSNLEIMGKISCEIKFNNVSILHNFLVPKNLKYDAIIGYDFLSKHNCILDMFNKLFKINKETINFDFVNYTQCNLLSNTKDFNSELKNLLLNFDNIFSKDKYDIGKCSIIEHTINVRGDAVRQPLRRLPHFLRNYVKSEIENMLNAGIITSSKSPWASPMVLVKKKNGEHRVCIDYRKLNSQTIKDSYPIPRIDDYLDMLMGAKVFSTLDLKNGYYQIPISEDDKEKTAMITPFGLYEFNVMPFGLCNAPATFQRVMTRILDKLIGVCCLVYMDDVIVYSKSMESHIEDLKKVMNMINQAGLKLHYDKCSFGQEKVNYLGYVISNNLISTDQNKIKAINQFPLPKTMKQLKSFLGLANYYRRFIPSFSALCAPLYELTRNKKLESWSKKNIKVFEEIKKALVSPSVLCMPDFNKEFFVTTDASDYAIGAILSQKNDINAGVVSYFSRKLSDTEKKYSVFEKEALAIVSAIKEFKYYLYGRKFQVFTDHNPLCYLKNIKDMHGRVARWLMFLQEYEFQVNYKCGSKNINADALSRIEIINNCFINNLQQTNYFLNEVNKDFKLKNFKKIINKHKNKYQTKRGIFSISKDGLIIRTHVCKNKTYCQIYVPKSLQKELLIKNHDEMCHPGQYKTFDNIREYYYWPGYVYDVHNYVKACLICQKSKVYPICSSKLQHYMPLKPFEIIQCDVVGPLPTSEKGNRFILVITDVFSKWVEAFPLTTVTSQVYVDIIIKDIISRYGIPKQIHTDQGTNFTSNIVHEICNKLQINKTNTTSYHPQSNGIVERSNKTLKEMLIKCLKPEKNWDNYLPIVLLIYRNMYHETIHCSPSEVLFGHRSILPKDFSFVDLFSDIYNNKLNTSMLKKEIYKYWDVARKGIVKTHSKIDKHHKIKNNNKININSMVWLLNPKIMKSKFESMWFGPFQVLSRKNNIYKILMDNGVTQKVHRNRLKQAVISKYNQNMESQPIKTTQKRNENLESVQIPIFSEDDSHIYNEKNILKRKTCAPYWLKDYIHEIKGGRNAT